MQINNSKELEQAIIELEKRKVIQLEILQSQFRTTAESLRPGNLIREAISKVVQPGDTRTMVFKLAGSVALGILTKRFMIGKTHSKAASLIGNAVKIGTTRAVINNADKIKAYGIAIYNNLFRKDSKSLN